MSDKVLRRDDPLPAGTVLEVSVTTIYSVPVSEWEGSLDRLTLDEIEVALGKLSGERCRELRANFDITDEWPETWCIADLEGVRFETQTERDFRTGNARPYAVDTGGPREYVDVPDPVEQSDG